VFIHIYFNERLANIISLKTKMTPEWGKKKSNQLTKNKINPAIQQLNVT